MRGFLGILLAFLACFGAAHLAAQPSIPPAPQRWVTDGAGVLSPGTRTELDRRLAAYEQATGHQVLVWIGGSSGELPLDDFAVRSFESWKVGRKGLDDGLVLFILAQDRRLRIEVGYGLEGQMPDALASRIIRERITPRLGQGDWDGAVREGVGGILETLGGEASASGKAQAHSRAKRSLGTGEMLVLGLLALGFLVLLITNPSLAIGLLFSILASGRGGGGGGGGWSGGGGRSGGGGASGSW